MKTILGLKIKPAKLSNCTTPSLSSVYTICFILCVTLGLEGNSQQRAFVDVKVRMANDDKLTLFYDYHREKKKESFSGRRFYWDNFAKSSSKPRNYRFWLYNDLDSLRKFRLDLGDSPNSICITSIKLVSKWLTKTWSPTQIANNFSFNDQVVVDSVSNDGVYVTTIGEGIIDPYITYLWDLADTITTFRNKLRAQIGANRRGYAKFCYYSESIYWRSQYNYVLMRLDSGWNEVDLTIPINQPVIGGAFAFPDDFDEVFFKKVVFDNSVRTKTFRTADLIGKYNTGPNTILTKGPNHLFLDFSMADRKYLEISKFKYPLFDVRIRAVLIVSFLLTATILLIWNRRLLGIPM